MKKIKPTISPSLDDELFNEKAVSVELKPVASKKALVASMRPNPATSISQNVKDIDSRYACYVLSLLLLANILNYLDRSILILLAEDIKADLGISDADLGFLYGSAFAVFYATFGITLGRLADLWNRKKLISIGLGFWSLMTALSGLSKSFLSLAVCRFGVGVGEASASPAAYSLIYDYFSPKRRTIALAVYASGVSIGSGAGFWIGGMILNTWNGIWPDASFAPFGLKGWQATFIIAGLPGLLVAYWLSTLREPVRGQGDQITSKVHNHPFRETVTTLMGMLPIINWWVLGKSEGINSGKKVFFINLVFGFTILLTAIGLIRLTGDVAQWVVVGAGFYAAISWAQGFALRDPIVYGMIFHTKTIVSLIVAQGAITFMLSGTLFWVASLFRRFYGVSASDLGVVLGLGIPILGLCGLILGGLIADKLREYNVRGKLYVYLVNFVGAILSAMFFLIADNLIHAYIGLLITYFMASVMGAPVLSTLNDLMLPRGRATVSAFFAMVATLGGAALGPYLIGYVSDSIVLTSVASADALRQAMLWSLLIPAAGIIPAIYALMCVEADEASLLDRARALGEEI